MIVGKGFVPEFDSNGKLQVEYKRELTGMDSEQVLKGFVDWQTLRKACNNLHSPGVGGATVCVCGKACGGSEYCSALSQLRRFFSELCIEDAPRVWREGLSGVKKAI